jgi:adenylate cyclase
LSAQPIADFHDFTTWLLTRGSALAAAAELFAAFNGWLNAHRFQILRANIASRSLHPQFGAVSMIWSMTGNVPVPPPATGVIDARKMQLGDGFVHLTRLGKVNFEADAFVKSPMAPVLLEGKTIRQRVPKTMTAFPYPIIKDLHAAGATDYLALPMRFKNQIEGFISLSTNAKEGFSDEQLLFLERATALFCLALEPRLKDELLETLLKLYLGETTGPLVLKGRIQRGDMESFESVIWFSDIRGFSALASIMQPAETIELLNTYYETICPVVREYGGEVLKFLGDGLLVIFSAEAGKERQAKYKSLIAANAAGRALKKLNRYRISQDKIPLEHGIGLHYGTIQYGNIGSVDRLDFTAIGSAVNIASRIAAQCAEIGRSVLISGDLAKFLRIRLDSHGAKELKGIPVPVEIFSLP